MRWLSAFFARARAAWCDLWYEPGASDIQNALLREQIRRAGG